MKQNCAQPIRPTGSPSKPRYEAVRANTPSTIPKITLTQPTALSSAGAMPLQNRFQQPLPQPPPPTTALRTAARLAEDYQVMISAMASGNFNAPVFGEAGAAFHREGRLVQTQRAPRKKVKANETGGGSGGTMPKPSRRKRKGDEEGGGGAVKKARGKKET